MRRTRCMRCQRCRSDTVPDPLRIINPRAKSGLGRKLLSQFPSDPRTPAAVGRILFPPACATGSGSGPPPAVSAESAGERLPHDRVTRLGPRRRRSRATRRPRRGCASPRGRSSGRPERSRLRACLHAVEHQEGAVTQLDDCRFAAAGISEAVIRDPPRPHRRTPATGCRPRPTTYARKRLSMGTTPPAKQTPRMKSGSTAWNLRPSRETRCITECGRAVSNRGRRHPRKDGPARRRHHARWRSARASDTDLPPDPACTAGHRESVRTETAVASMGCDAGRAIRSCPLRSAAYRRPQSTVAADHRASIRMRRDGRESTMKLRRPCE